MYDRGESTFIVGARSCIKSRSQHDDHTIQAPMKPITGPGPHSSGTRALDTYTLTLMRYQVDVERAGQRPPQRCECPRRRGRLHTPPCEAKASTKKPAQRNQQPPIVRLIDALLTQDAHVIDSRLGTEAQSGRRAARKRKCDAGRRPLVRTSANCAAVST